MIYLSIFCVFRFLLTAVMQRCHHCRYVLQTGEELELLNLAGTLPILYQEQTYNIPIKEQSQLPHNIELFSKNIKCDR